MYIPPLLEHFELAEVEHNPRGNRMRAIGAPCSIGPSAASSIARYCHLDDLILPLDLDLVIDRAAARQGVPALHLRHGAADEPGSGLDVLELETATLVGFGLPRQMHVVGIRLADAAQQRRRIEFAARKQLGETLFRVGRGRNESDDLAGRRHDHPGCIAHEGAALDRAASGLEGDFSRLRIKARL
jgi:hypothetical protein